MPQSDFLSLTPNVNSAPKRAHWLHSGRVGHKPGAEHCNWWHWSNYCKELKRVTSWISWCQILRQQQEGRSLKLPAQILMLELCFSLCSKGCDCSSYWQLADLSVCSSLSLSVAQNSYSVRGAGLNIRQIIHCSKKSFSQAGISTRLSKHFHWIQAAAGHLKWSI